MKFANLGEIWFTVVVCMTICTAMFPEYMLEQARGLNRRGSARANCYLQVPHRCLILAVYA
jgi:hypothetical protein